LSSLMLCSKWNRTNSFRPHLVTALSVFFWIGAAISLTASVSLFQPDSFLEPMWRLNIRAHRNLSGLGLWAVVLLSVVSALCAAVALGLWRGSKWGVLACGRSNDDKPCRGCDQCGGRHRAKSNRRRAHRDSNIGVFAAE